MSKPIGGLKEIPQFVIGSAFKKHTLEAFELGVVDYLVKPFSEERVEQYLRRVLARRPARGGPATGGIPARMLCDVKRAWSFWRWTKYGLLKLRTA